MKKKMSILSIITAIILLSAMLSFSITHRKSHYVKRKESISNKKTGDQQDSIQITLNGIEAGHADSMKTQFSKYKGQDFGPIQQSVWFDHTTIKRICDLLCTEKKKQTAGSDGKKGLTDGIRIYFVSDLSVKKGHLKNSIILVSTKNDGPSATAPTGYLHRDYYTHAKNDILFSDLNSIKGLTLPRQLINTRGENLYNIYYSIKDVKSCDEPHYIYRTKAYKMVNQFGRIKLKKDTINTISEWFDLDLFKSFADDKKNDGLRIYFTRHPKNYRKKADKYKYQDAFVLITTKRVKFLKRFYHNDYFDCRTTKSYFQKLVLESFYKIHTRATSSGGDDNGELCQPNCQQ